MATHGRMQETPNRRLCCALLSVKELLKHNGCPLGRLRNCCLPGGQQEQHRQCCLICCLLGGQQEQHLRQPRTRNHAPPAFLYYVLKIDNQFLVRRFFDKYAFTAQKLRTNKRFLEISTSKSCFRLFGDLKIYGLIRCFRKPVRKKLVYIYFGSQKLRTKTDF